MVALANQLKQPGKMKIPGMPDFNPMRLLHGEEKVEMYSPIEIDSTVVVTKTIHDLIDKGKATIMVTLKELRDKESGELKARIYSSSFIRGHLSYMF